MSSIGIGVGVRGEFLGCPLEASVWTDDGSVCWKGNLQLRGEGLRELIRYVDPELLSVDVSESADPTAQLLSCLVDDFIGNVRASLVVTSKPNLKIFELDTLLLTVRAIRRGPNSAFVLKLTESSFPTPGALGFLLQSLAQAKRALCLDDLFLAYRKGPALSVADLTGGVATSTIPPLLADARWLGYSKFKFDDTSEAGKAIHAVLGLRELDVYVGMDPGQSKYEVCLSLPTIQNKYLTSHGLYLVVGVEGAYPLFEFRGDFEFAFLKGLTFIANCSFTPTSFALAAELSAKDPIAVPGLAGFSFANAALLVGYFNGGPTFGLFATVYVRELMLFGAIIVNVQGPAPVPALVSGAIDPVSLPSLYRNFTGEQLAGLDALDVISVDRFRKFDFTLETEILKARDKAAVVKAFNAGIKNEPSLTLTDGRIEIRTCPQGFGLSDQKHMRHYFVDNNGQVFLQAQFYVSCLPKEFTFCEFTISPGIFFCGAIELLGKRLEVLFSLRPNEGLLAYAKLDPLDFKIGGFKVFRLSSSTNPVANPIKLPDKELASKLVPEKPSGLVFFLSASKKDVTFYFDGRLDLLEIFHFDARIIYYARNVSIHAEISVWGIRTVFLLDAAYGNFLKSEFSFLLRVDTKGLTDALTTVTQRIDQAIVKLQEKIGDAQRALNNAQSQVNQLRGEVQYLNQKIDSCKYAISSASWWKKVPVAIAKGAEIVAYEVAIAGIWTAIGVATAALELAKVAVSAFGALSTGVMELVNATIRTATSLLFIRSAEISVHIDESTQKFAASVEFVALGKQYHVGVTVDLAVFKQGISSFLSHAILGDMEPDLKRVEQGQNPQELRSRAMHSPWHAVGAVGPDGAYVADIAGAAVEISKASAILSHLQTRYRARFGENLAEFDALNASYSSALQHARNTLGTVRAAAPRDELTRLATQIRQLDRTKLTDTKRQQLERALNGVDDAIARHDHVHKAFDATVEATGRVEALAKQPPTRDRGLKPTPMPPNQQMLEFLQDMQEEIQAAYPEDHDTGYINLTMEKRLHDYFHQAMTHLGHDPAKPLRPSARVRSVRTPPVTYRQRL
jgi:hypothetical protein